MDSPGTWTAPDGVELAYRLSRPTAPTERLLVLLHGVASNHTRWSELVERTTLTRSWALLRPDLRGNGASMTRTGQSIAVWCDDLLGMLRSTGYERAVLVGHSLGAQVAMHLAHRAPERVAGLVLIDPVVAAALRGMPRRWARNRWLLRLAASGIGALNALGLHRRRFPSRDIRELDERTREDLAGDASFETIARKYSALGPILRHMPTANYLRQVLATIGPLPPLEAISAPALVLLSAGVTFADPQVTRREIGRLPQVGIRTLQANHWPLTETPDETRQAIERWIDRRWQVVTPP